MKKVRWVVGGVTLYLVFFQLTPVIGVPERIIYLLYLLAPVLVTGMVIFTLKYGKPSQYTFEDRFYEDRDYQRNGKDP